MLIPFVNENPEQAALEICNSYVNKLASEALQCLLASLFVLHPDRFCAFKGLEELPARYGYTSHPFVRDWICKSSYAWDWTMRFALASCREYSRRYDGRVHAAEEKLTRLQRHRPEYTCSDCIDPPLPSAACAVEGATRVQEFQRYFRKHKNADRWQFLYEPRAPRPAWMGKRTRAQDDIVERTRERIAKKVRVGYL